LLVFAALISTAACKQKRKWAAPEPLGEHAFLASAIEVADPASNPQLLTGFYPAEGTWCWTKKDFSVVLGSPGTGREKGARIVLSFALPDVLIHKLKSITIYAVLNGVALPPDTYSKTGESRYSRDLPPSIFTTEKINVDFHLDKAIPPSTGDPRELGIVVSAIGFENK